MTQNSHVLEYSSYNDQGGASQFGRGPGAGMRYVTGAVWSGKVFRWWIVSGQLLYDIGRQTANSQSLPSSQ